MIREVCHTAMVFCAGLLMPADAACGQAAAMDRCDIAIVHQFRGAAVEWHDSQLTVSSKGSITVSRLDYLISQVRVERTDGTRADLTGQYFLVSAADDLTTISLRNVPPGPFRTLSFVVGVEKETNHADPAHWPVGHPLNVLENNLHWGWKGGYVFLAAEGRIHGQASRPSFLYHLGGDDHCVTVTLTLEPPVPNLATTQLLFHVDRLWSAVSPIDVHGTETLTHSSEGDPLPLRLKANLARCFEAATRD